jgi:hypothetical protein
MRWLSVSLGAAIWIVESGNPRRRMAGSSEFSAAGDPFVRQDRVNKGGAKKDHRQREEDKHEASLLEDVALTARRREVNDQPSHFDPSSAQREEHAEKGGRPSNRPPILPPSLLQRAKRE